MGSTPATAAATPTKATVDDDDEEEHLWQFPFHAMNKLLGGKIPNDRNEAFIHHVNFHDPFPFPRSVAHDDDERKVMQTVTMSVEARKVGRMRVKLNIFEREYYYYSPTWWMYICTYVC